jgi:hypothetical protein
LADRWRTLACMELYLLPDRAAVVAMVVTSGCAPNNGRRVFFGAQADGSPTPGRAWLPSTGVTRWVAW